MRYKKAKKLVEKSFGDDNIIIEFGYKFKFYPRLRRQIKLWARELEDKYVEIDLLCRGEEIETIEEAIESLEKKGMVVFDEEMGVRLTEAGCDTAKWLLENDPFSKELFKKLQEEEKNEA